MTVIVVPLEKYNPEIHQLPQSGSTTLYAWDQVTLLEVVDMNTFEELFVAEITPPFWVPSGRVLEDAAYGEEVKIINREGLLFVRER